jgi:hypothetical protein
MKDKNLAPALNFNGRESAVKRAPEGSTNPSSKLVPSSLCKKYLLLRNTTTYTMDW